MHVKYSHSPEERGRIPETGVKDGCGPPCGLETKSESHEEQCGLLTTEKVSAGEPSLQPQECQLFLKRTRIQFLCKLGDLRSNPWH